MQEKYFAASNSARGFVNYFEPIFAPADFVYIIKGGPGTGKSSVMKRCAATAESRGDRVEYYYCSSDPSSLDGILIFEKNRTVGFIDGTAPHVSEPKFPGAKEEIINLGQFWDRELLIKQKNEIISLCERKSAEYKNAYTYLRSVGNLRAVKDSLVLACVDAEKLERAAERILSFLPDGDGKEAFKCIPTVTECISMSGRVRFDTFEQRARRIYRISDPYGVGRMLMNCLRDKLCRKSVTARVSYDPICPNDIDGIFIENHATAFVLCSESSAVDEYSEREGSGEQVLINSKRFIVPDKLRESRGEIRYTARIAQNALDGALHALSKARIYHFLLEDIYGKAMDWSSKDAFERKIRDSY